MSEATGETKQLTQQEKSDLANKAAYLNQFRMDLEFWKKRFNYYEKDLSPIIIKLEQEISILQSQAK